MASTYHLYQTYGLLSPTESGTNLFAKCKYYPAPIIQEATVNRIYSFDGTADYATYSLTGMVGYFDFQFGSRGIGSARYTLDGSSPTPNIKLPSSSYYDTGTNTYKTGSLYVYSEHSLEVRLDLQLQDSGGTSVGGTDSTTATLVANSWNRIEVTSSTNGQRFLMTLNILNFSSSTDTGKRFYIDQVQVEDKRYATSFYNSASRSASNISFSLPKISPDYTITGWAKVGNQTSSAALGSATFFTLYNTSTDYATVRYNEGTTKVQAFKDDVDPNTDFSTSTIDLNPGDLVFFALVNDGLTMTVYFAKDGGTLISANQTTDFSVFDTIYIGRDPVNSYWLNGPVENLLIHKKALSQSNIESIFNSATPLDYTYTNDVIFAYATPTTLASSKALSYTGTGMYRYKNVTASLDILSATNMSVNAEYSSSAATHLVYGPDVSKLELNGYIATSTDLTQASIYRISSIMDVLNQGMSAFVYKG